MKIEDVFRKLRPIMGTQLDALWQEYLAADTPLRQTIERTLRILLAQRLAETFDSEHVLLPPPPPDRASGPYAVGTIRYGRHDVADFGVREDEFIQHIGIFGRSGSGKTNLAFLLLDALTRANKPFLVFDWKRNYRDLLTLTAFKDVRIYTVGRNVAPIRINPLIPPAGTQPTVWLKKLIEIVCHAYFLGEGVTVLLMRAMDHLYRDRGLYRGDFSNPPTMADVRDFLASYPAKGREASWMESARRAVDVLCFGEMGRVLNAVPPCDLAQLLPMRVVLELDALTNADKTFLIESLLLWIHHFRLAQGARETFKHAILIEEAHHVLLRKKQEVTGEETVTDVLLREIRELGEGVILLDQHPSLISKPALGNTYTTFCFNLKHRGDITMIQDSLHLDAEQAGYLNRLDVGWSVVKLQGRWVYPFLVRLPHFQLHKGVVSDGDIRARHQPLPTLSGQAHLLTEPDSEPIALNGDPSGAVGTKDGHTRPIPRADKQVKRRCAIQLTTQELKLLQHVQDDSGYSVTERYQDLHFSSRLGDSLQHSLAARGLLRSLFIPVGTARVKALELTDPGRQVLGVKHTLSRRHGGLVHRYWSDRIARELRAAGFKVEQEHPLGGGAAVDLLVVTGKRRIGVEIETGASDVEANIEKCLAAGLDRVILVPTHRALHVALRRYFSSDTRVRIVEAWNVATAVRDERNPIPEFQSG